MTIENIIPPATDARIKLSRRVSSLAMPIEEDADRSETFHVLIPEKAPLRRQVSNEALSVAESDLSRPKTGCGDTRAFQNPLNRVSIFSQHRYSLQLEASLQPMRLILTRLMAHPTFNRKGLFNFPVDPIALRLPDYSLIISSPMDFGTVKARLHALAYKCREDCLYDILLVMDNAMKYNPPTNAVHIAAARLREFFKDQLESFLPDLAKLLTRAQGTCAHSSTATSSALVAPTGLSLDEGSLNGDSFSSPMKPICVSVVDPQDRSDWHSSPQSDLCDDALTARKRKKHGSCPESEHNCYICQGRKCSICHQGCLHHEPSLLICGGASCAGAKIRKGATYYVAPDGSRQYCQRCYAGLPPVLPATRNSKECRYKVSFLKRKNDEEIVERWVTCVECHNGVHTICAFRMDFIGDEGDDFVCPQCLGQENSDHSTHDTASRDCSMYTFMSGCEHPIPMSHLGHNHEQGEVCADTLLETSESMFLQRKIRERMESDGVPNSEKTVLVRIISDCDQSFEVPEVIRKHFYVQGRSGTRISPPMKVNYRSKSIALFQKNDGLDVCIFCMYVQEYDGDDDYNVAYGKNHVNAKKRVYIAYLDSVEHFRPRKSRTHVFQEVLVSYLASARQRGYEYAHIWACPPTRGSSFVFWSHPTSQRTPTQERLLQWYHEALSRAVKCGIVEDVKSLYEACFEDELDNVTDRGQGKGNMECPPLLHGDFWIEEVMRIHEMNFQRYLKAKRDGDLVPTSRCPALELSVMIRDKLIPHPSCVLFRKPVNAAALNLLDYHDVIRKPMDLGTVYAQLVLGEYKILQEVVDDVDLVFNNARQYNPPGNPVHHSAIEMSVLFYNELSILVNSWPKEFGINGNKTMCWTDFSGLSMNLDIRFSDSSKPACTQKFIDNSLEASKSRYREPSGSSSHDILQGGAKAIRARMLGTDSLLHDKELPASAKDSQFLGKKEKDKQRTEKPQNKLRRQCWLAEELGTSVRLHRASIFYCHLSPQKESRYQKSDHIAFEAYIAGFTYTEKIYSRSAPIVDARHAFLEFSQYRNLEFDTLRRAKYSTAVLLHYLHEAETANPIPNCTMCRMPIQLVRWHRTSRVIRKQDYTKRRRLNNLQQNLTCLPEELCSRCHENHSEKDEFIPIQVSFQ